MRERETVVAPAQVPVHSAPRLYVRLRPARLLVTLLIGYLLLTAFNGLVGRDSVDRNLASVQRETVLTQERIQELTQERADLQNQEVIETYARRQLGMIRPGETVYRFPTNGATAAAEAGASAGGAAVASGVGSPVGEPSRQGDPATGAAAISSAYGR